MKQEGGTVVNKNFYPPPPPPPPPPLPHQQGFNPPNASQSARPHTKLQNTTCEETQSRPTVPSPASEPPKQQGSTTGAATKQHIWMSDYRDKLGKRAKRAERNWFKKIPAQILIACPDSE